MSTTFFPEALRGQKIVTFAVMVVLALVAFALLTPFFAKDPFSLAGMSIMDSYLPPSWMEGGDPNFPLGSDEQGRNLLAAIGYGLRTSILVGAVSVVIGVVLGGGLGLLAGFVDGKVDAAIMWVADIQLAYPALLLAMVIDGAVTAAMGTNRPPEVALAVVTVSIGVACWVQYARTIRASVMVERDQDYVAAARITGRSTGAIMIQHVLPNVMAPILVIATINFGIAIITEATLSFLGIGIPPTYPSLGALIRNGNQFIQSGEWWIAAFPCLALVILVIAVNVVGDHLRDFYNPKIKGR